MKNPNPWYNKTILVVLSLIILFPVGLYALWKNEKAPKPLKIAVSILIAFFVIYSVNTDRPAPEFDIKAEKEKQFDKKAAKIKVDSLEKEISKIKNFSYSDKDEFKSVEWIKPKSERKTFDNTIYAYYGKDSSSVYSPRIVIRYYGEDWIFWKKAVFLIDGKVFNFIPEENPSRDNNSEVWEISDSNLTDFFIEKFMSFKTAKSVKYRLEGDYSKDFTLSKSKINSIYNILLLNKMEMELFEIKNKLQLNK
jgi:hypothetical protein